jgi:UDP-N-acetylmuramyl pentapeptide phosphotransferase/UDP-N-acetylglucosamine-1-phosphate transferase
LLNVKITIMGKTLGIIMIIVGAAMLIWTGFSFTKKEKVVDIGPVEISADKKEHVNWPPYIGGIVLVAGIVVMATSKKK